MCSFFIDAGLYLIWWRADSGDNYIHSSFSINCWICVKRWQKLINCFSWESIISEFIASTIALLIPLGFYHLGHSPVISSIPWNAAFVGIPGGTALRVLPALFVLFHLNFSAISSIFVISSESESSQKVRDFTEKLKTLYNFRCLHPTQLGR